jgi:hypothetical protein
MLARLHKNAADIGSQQKCTCPWRIVISGNPQGM